MESRDLKSDCLNCQGLCCVAPPFAQSTEFAYAKAEGETCHYLNVQNRCTVHGDLAGQGFTGCVKFECFGAGQKVTNHHFKGQNWRENHLTAKRMFHIFFIVKALQQKISVLQNQQTPPAAGEIEKLERLTYAGEEELLGLDLAAL